MARFDSSASVQHLRVWRSSATLPRPWRIHHDDAAHQGQRARWLRAFCRAQGAGGGAVAGGLRAAPGGHRRAIRRDPAQCGRRSAPRGRRPLGRSLFRLALGRGLSRGWIGRARLPAAQRLVGACGGQGDRPLCGAPPASHRHRLPRGGRAGPAGLAVPARVHRAAHAVCELRHGAGRAPAAPTRWTDVASDRHRAGASRARGARQRASGARTQRALRQPAQRAAYQGNCISGKRFWSAAPTTPIGGCSA